MVTPQLRNHTAETSASPLLLNLPLLDMVSVRRCADACLPAGESFLIQLGPATTSQPAITIPFPVTSPVTATYAFAGHAASSSTEFQPAPVVVRPGEGLGGLQTGQGGLDGFASAGRLGAGCGGAGRALRDVFLVADDTESADAWVDALLLCSYMVTTRSPQVLAHALAPKQRPKG